MFLQKIINAIFPSNIACVCCKNDVFNDDHQICRHCIKSLPFLTGKLCIRCSNPIVGEGNYCLFCKGKKSFLNKCIAPFVYDGQIKTLIYGLKYQNKKYLARPAARFMADLFEKQKLSADVITFVPLCEKRLKQRGYNQAEEIAKYVSEFLNIQLNNSLLKRVKETPSQTELDYKQRQENLKNAFKMASRGQAKDKTILLIDDVYTTGATSEECAKTLKKAGAKCVYVLTFAHTVKK